MDFHPCHPDIPRHRRRRSACISAWSSAPTTRSPAGRGRHLLIRVGDVVYFEATDKYVNVVTADSASLIRMSLRERLDRLDPAQFW